MDEYLRYMKTLRSQMNGTYDHLYSKLKENEKQGELQRSVTVAETLITRCGGSSSEDFCPRANAVNNHSSHGK